MTARRRRFRDRSTGRAYRPEPCAWCGKVYASPHGAAMHFEEHLYPEARGREVARWHEHRAGAEAGQ